MNGKKRKRTVAEKRERAHRQGHLILGMTRAQLDADLAALGKAAGPP